MNSYKWTMIALLFLCAAASSHIVGVPGLFVALALSIYFRATYETKPKKDLFYPPTLEEAQQEYVDYLRAHVRPVFETASPDLQRLVEQVVGLTESSVYGDRKQKSKD